MKFTTQLRFLLDSGWHIGQVVENVGWRASVVEPTNRALAVAVVATVLNHFCKVDSIRRIHVELVVARLEVG